MPNSRKVEDEVLMERIARTFKDVGYEGASLSSLSEATGLKKSSLYHRFPRGKEQMAEEVLAQVGELLDAELFPVLADDSAPEQKVTAFVELMDALYASGRESCLLNMLCPPRGTNNGSSDAIATTFRRLLDGLGSVASQDGADADESRQRAEEALITIQGALVVARGTNDATVFERALVRIPSVLLGTRHGKQATGNRQ